MKRKVFERYLREPEERQLFAAIKRQAGSGNLHQQLAMRDYAWMRLLRYTGIRIETMAGLNVADAKAALASKYLDLRPEITKGHGGGKVFCTVKALAALRTLLKVRRQMGYPDNDAEPLVYSRKHQRMAIRSYQQRMALWVKAAGLNVHASPHWWRHTLGKRLMKNSTATDKRGVVQGALNHTDINSTAIYTMPDRDDIEQAMEEVNR